MIEIRDKYGDERRSEIIYASEEMNPEDFYADDEMIITISHLGYIKRTPLSEFRTQNRGGVGTKGSQIRDEDFVEYIYPATNHNYMLFFTQKGKCYWLRVYEIPEGTKTSKGRAIQNLLNIDSDDSITAFVRVLTLEDEAYINSHYLYSNPVWNREETLLEAYSRPLNGGSPWIERRRSGNLRKVDRRQERYHPGQLERQPFVSRVGCTATGAYCYRCKGNDAGR